MSQGQGKDRNGWPPLAPTHKGRQTQHGTGDEEIAGRH